jgi:hypothetical protein
MPEIETTPEPIRKRVVTTGELRGALQPVRFLYLTAPALTTSGEQHFSAGDHVAAMYWGNGIVRLTKVNSHDSRPVLAHSIRAEEPTSIDEGSGEGN